MDSLLFWNEVALEANKVTHSKKEGEQKGPVLSARALAIVHVAMHDAYMGMNGQTTTWLGNLPAPKPGASVDAAISAAALTSLEYLYPSQKNFFLTKSKEMPATAGKADGFAYGIEIANRVINIRKNDPTNSDEGYVAPIGRGAHKSDPNNEQGYLAPFYGKRSSLFSANTKHELDPPATLNSPEYNRVASQVYTLGIAPELTGGLDNGADKRTPEQTLIGIFWGYDGANGLGTPPRLYNQIVRKVAIAKGNDLEANVRLFAMINVAMADAGILAWREKYRYNLWRPVVGIREHDLSMGECAEPMTGPLEANCDPGWLPLGAPKTNGNGAKNFTPDFPAYPSGHATFGAAALHMTRMFYDPNLKGNRSSDNLFDGLTFVSEEFNGVNRDNNNTLRPSHSRSFQGGLWDMIVENGISRVYLGVHWSFDAFKTDNNNDPIFNHKTGGVDLGIAIAEDIFVNGLNKSAVGPDM